MIIKRCFKHPETVKRFDLKLNNKVVVFLGWNGSGKTTLMKCIEQKLQEDYTIINDDNKDSTDNLSYIQTFEPENLMIGFKSEGEQMLQLLGRTAKKIGGLSKENKLIVLFDKLDSGLSIDRIKEMTTFIKSCLVKDKNIEKIIISANSYELASQFISIADFYWLPTNEYIPISSYEEFINMYDDETISKYYEEEENYINK